MELLDPHGFNEIRKCRYGTFLFNKNDWPIGTSLRTYGEYAMEELELLKKLIKPTDIVVDAGANIGTHTVWFSKLAAAVISFEPQRIAYQTLCANVALNSCLNVHALHAALGSKDGSIIVPMRDQYKPNNFGGVPLAGVTEGEPTELMRLDSVHFNRCDFIKADIEGMEAEFLAGAQDTLNKFRPILYMEADGAQAVTAINMLFDLDYQCYWSCPNLYNPMNLEDNADDVFMLEDGRPMVSVNMLAIPAERNIEVIGLSRITDPAEPPMMALVCSADADERVKAYFKKIIEKQQQKEMANV